MKLRWTALFSLAVCGCVEEPTPKDAETAAVAMEKDTANDLIKERQKSIEQAADEAVKLIEADAKAEIDANTATGK
jgi:Tfp pilus assembly protein PilF